MYVNIYVYITNIYVFLKANHSNKSSFLYKIQIKLLKTVKNLFNNTLIIKL